MTEQENTQAFNACMDAIRNMEPPEWMEWWEVENTGWSGGRSWFPISQCRDNRRFKSQTDALKYIADNRWDDDPSMKWRTVHVTLQRKENQSITTRTWTEI